MEKEKFPLVSVIIPVYKVENYLKRCVDSVLAQTYENIEIILVDDGSPDNCGEMCDEYARADSRVVVIHKENGGVSAARNIGVERSHGEYVTFVDSDDYISPDYVEYLYSLLFDNDADVAIAGFNKTSDDSCDFASDSENNVKIINGKEACEKLLDGMRFMQFVTPWVKLFKRKIIHKYPFPVGRRYEDEATLYKIYYSACRVAYSDKVLYAYYDNLSSYMNTRGGEFKKDWFSVMYERAEFFAANNEKKLSRRAYKILIRYLANDSLNYKRRSDELLYDIAKKKWHSKYFPSCARIYVISYKISPKLFGKIKKVI